MTLAKGKNRDRLTEGLPSKIRINLDWDGTCDLKADRRNCIIHRGLLGKDEITRPTVEVHKITFIWRGDARIEVQPDAAVLERILTNDQAAAGMREWPTGQETVYQSLAHIKVYDLRPQRERRRRWMQSHPEAVKASKRAWEKRDPEAVKAKNRRDRVRVAAAKKGVRTKETRGRFSLT